MGRGFSSFSLWVVVGSEHLEISIRDTCAHTSPNHISSVHPIGVGVEGSLFSMSVLGFGKGVWK